MCYRFFLVVLFIFTSLPMVQAQPDLGKYLRAGAADAEKLLNPYMEPLGRGMSAAMTNGWYHTARTHKPFRFDVVLMASCVYMPDDLLSFAPSDLGLENTTLTEPADGQVPTIIGSEDISSTYTWEYEGSQGTFAGPPGLDAEDKFNMQAVPVPLLQLGIGTIKNTDIKIRLSPKFRYENVRYQAYGVAVMHSLSQYFTTGFLTKYDWSFLAGYTTADMVYDLKNSELENVETPDGEGILRSSGWTVQTLISRYIHGITVYAGAGYYKASTDMDLNGSYTLFDDNGEELEQLRDPVSLGYGQNGPRFTAGIQLEFAVITLHADYTFQKYNSLTIGLGILAEWKEKEH